MVKMKIETYVKLEPVKYYQISGAMFNASEVNEFIYMLDDRRVDGFINFIYCDNLQLVKLLEELEVIKTNIRGSCYRGEKFKDFADAIGYDLEEDYD